MMVATDVKCIKSFARLKAWGTPEVKSISKRSGTCTWYSTDTKCVVSNVGVPQTCFKEKGVLQQHMEPCKVVLVVVVVVAVAEVAPVGHGLMRTTTCRKGLEFYRTGWPLSQKNKLPESTPLPLG